jgi:hypothetical protein
MNQPKCKHCQDDPRGVLGLNSYSACPHCNELPMSGATKDRAVYDLAKVLAKPSPRAGRPDDDRRRSS